MSRALNCVFSNLLLYLTIFKTFPSYRTKHVSFARSHTLTTFDDSVMPAAVGGSRFRRDCERLIDGRIVKVMHFHSLLT